MNKEQILNGMSEDDFYRLYPTEDHYNRAMGGPSPEEIEEFKKGGGFKINPDHKGWCTPMTKPTCTGARRQFAINAKNHFKKQELGGEHCPECEQHMDMGGSPFNYGAFPAMISGGDVSNIIHGLAKKQYGGSDQSQFTSTDNILEDKKNFFNNYIRNNVSKVIANEVAQEFQGQHLMPDGSMMNNSEMQYGGPWEQGYGQNMGYPEGWSSPQNFGTNQPLPWEDPNAKPSDEASQEDIDRMYAGKAAQFIPTQGVDIAKTEDPYFSTSNPYAGQKTISGLQPNPNLATFNPNAPQAPEVQNTIMDPTQMRTDRPECTEAEKRDPNSKCYVKPGSSFDFSITAPNHGEQLLQSMNLWSGLMERSANAKWEKDNKWRESGDANFIAQNRDNRGDYEVNSGDFRPDEKVPVQFRGTPQGNIGTNNYYAQMGGSFNEGDEVYMSDADIENYLKSGGQVQYID